MPILLPILSVVAAAIFSGCFHYRREIAESVSTVFTGDGAVASYKASGTCESTGEVASRAADMLEKLCDGRNYAVTEESPHSRECIDGRFKTDVKANCR